MLAGILDAKLKDLIPKMLCMRFELNLLSKETILSYILMAAILEFVPKIFHKPVFRTLPMQLELDQH